MTEEKIKHGLPDKGTKTVSEISVTYTQEADSNDAGDLQSLTMSTSDAGGGVFFIIKTERWAIDDLQDLVTLIEDFKSRL